MTASAEKAGHSQFYAQHNLVSDIAGLADHTDPNMVNAWGLDSGPTTPWWVSDNGTGKATLYFVNSGAITIFTVPGAGSAQGRPTGLVFNGGTGFVVNNGVGAPSAARFIFTGEDGTISAFKGAPIVTVVPNANAVPRWFPFNHQAASNRAQVFSRYFRYLSNHANMRRCTSN